MPEQDFEKTVENLKKLTKHLHEWAIERDKEIGDMKADIATAIELFAERTKDASETKKQFNDKFNALWPKHRANIRVARREI
jgi:hypothetical protein